MSNGESLDELKALIELSKDVIATRASLNQILSSLPVAFVIVSDNRTIQASTEQFKKLTGWEAEEITGDDLAKLLTDQTFDYAKPIEEPVSAILKRKNGTSVKVLVKSGKMDLNHQTNFCYCFMELI